MLKKRPRPTGKKKPPTGTHADLNLSTMMEMFADEDKARAFVEAQRWPNGPVCPHCQSTEAYKLTAKPGSKSPVRPGVYKCKKCRKQFTVRVGSIFEDSKIPLRHWLAAMHLVTSSKKGISSHQLARELGITVKSAWFLSHRIREAMKREPLAGMLRGTIEADETYVGARKPRLKGTSKRGRGTSKQPVMVLVERDGQSVAMPVERVDGKTLKGAIRQCVDKSATIMTDEWSAYTGIGEEFEGGHRTVNHREEEYGRYDADGTFVSSNTAESWFALLKRAHYGIHHQMSKRHLHRYCTERSFMWNFRKVSDGERLVAAIKGAEGRRLMYREPAAE